MAIGGLVRIYERTGRHTQAEALALTEPNYAVPELARLRAEHGDRDGAGRRAPRSIGTARSIGTDCTNPRAR
jgi:hypothetical protein